MSRHSKVGMTTIFNQGPAEFPSVCSTTPTVWTLPFLHKIAARDPGLTSTLQVLWEKRQRRRVEGLMTDSFKKVFWKLPYNFPFYFLWSEFSQIATPSCKENWEIKSLLGAALSLPKNQGYFYQGIMNIEMATSSLCYTVL